MVQIEVIKLDFSVLILYNLVEQKLNKSKGERQLYARTD